MSKASGKHNPDSVLLGIHTSPEVKALAGLVAEMTGSNITDTILDGLFRTAYENGITTRDGKVSPRYRDDIILRAGQVRAAKKERQGK